MTFSEKTAESIVVALRRQEIPWRRKWALGSPREASSGNIYRGMNAILLQLTQRQSCYWTTYRRWGLLDCQVQRREKGTQINARDIHGQPIFLYNAEQVCGPDSFRWSYTPETKVEFTKVQQVLENTHAEFKRGPKALYRRFGQEKGDLIELPDRMDFITDTEYFSTALHELVHWTEWRLGWHGDEETGELIAELATCQIEADLNLPNSSDTKHHEAHVEAWIKSMETNPRFIFDAAQQAVQAADFILSFSQPEKNDEL